MATSQSQAMGSSPARQVIEFEGVTKKFGKRTVLDNLSFGVPEGSVVGLLGPNGAGKSTAMRVLLGLHKANGGTARILGHSPGSAGFREAVRKVGAIIEAPPVYKHATPMQNLAIRVAATDLSVNDADVREIINQVGLSSRENDKVGDFSLGMRQRMGLALALVGNPSIVVLDEPTNGLDPEGAVEIRNIVKGLPQRGATALVCTHRLDEIERTCDYVVVLQKGRLIAQGTLDDIINQASTTGGHRIDVHPAELERAFQIISGLGLGDISIEGTGIVTSGVAPDPATITRSLADAGIYMTGLQTHRATLEDAFLEITGEAGASHEG